MKLLSRGHVGLSDQGPLVTGAAIDQSSRATMAMPDVKA
jgi:hypothetical protein